MTTYPAYAESWTLAKILVDRSTDLNTSFGIDQLRTLYEAVKIPALGALFPPDGRIDIALDGLPLVLDWNEMIAQLHPAVLAYSDKQIVKARYGDIAPFGEYLAEWVLSEAYRFKPDEVGKNQTQEGKGPAISTLIGGLFNAATESWNGGIQVVGDYNFHLRRIPFAQRELAKDYCQLIFGYVVEKVRPYLDQTLRLCLSINPFDILATSMHTTGWRTCHHLRDGQHKAGNLAFLCDSRSAVAFVYRDVTPFQIDDKENGRAVVLDDVPYPRKLWRALVFFDLENRQAIIGRQFPDYQSVYSVCLRGAVAKVLFQAIGKETTIRVRRHEGGESLPYERFDRGSFGRSVNGIAWNYVDTPTEWIVADGGNFNTITIGTGTIPCAYCGDERLDTTSTGDLLCGDCRNQRSLYRPGLDTYHCHHCGIAHPAADTVWYDNMPHCHTCIVQHEEAV